MSLIQFSSSEPVRSKDVSGRGRSTEQGGAELRLLFVEKNSGYKLYLFSTGKV